MILIFSQKKHQSTVEEVMDWLAFYDQKYKRVNDVLSLDIEHDFNNVSAIWFWRLYAKNVNIQADSIKNTKNIIKGFKSENKAKTNFLFYKLRNKYWLSHHQKSLVNKLIVLDKAKEFGFKIPDSIHTGEKKNLIEFKQKYGRLITKCIDNTFPLMSKERYVMFYTKEIKDAHVSTLPNYFESSFFQEHIDNKFEIRVFFIEKKIYSMAIMTPADEVDYRKKTDQLRKVPYQLPIEIEEKIKLLMHDLDLNTASIDLMCGKDDVIYFLEVNPVGQLGMVSQPCNYYLEKEIAINLTKHNEEIN